MALRGIKVLELSGLAPVPFCGMILSDFGASVVRVDRTRVNRIEPIDGLARGKKSIALDISKATGANVLKRLTSQYDVLIDPYRPGVLEKLGLGPDVLHTLNPALIMARISGYGQTGPLKNKAGHDINYVAMSGLLSVLGHHDRKPFPPVNLLADFAGGGLLCAFGICLALIERSKSGRGQVVDNSMTEGAAYVGSFIWRTKFPKESLPLPVWGQPRGQNLLDGGAAFYQTYKTRDGRYMAVGALEPKFYLALLKGLKLEEDEYPQFEDQAKLRERFSECFALKTQTEWIKTFQNLDACVTPVLNLEDAYLDPLHKDRNAFFIPNNSSKYNAPHPAPRLSVSSVAEQVGNERSNKEPQMGEHTLQVLQSAGFSSNEIQELLREDIIEGVDSKL